MNEAVQFLKDTGIFYVATQEAGQPRVRPFGGVLEHGGRAYFCTGNFKRFFKQCMADPRVEICACKPNGKWLRIEGSVVFENNAEVKKRFFEEIASLSGLYKGATDPLFEVFCMKDAKATFYSFTEAPKTVAF